MAGGLMSVGSFLGIVVRHVHTTSFTTILPYYTTRASVAWHRQGRAELSNV